MNLLSRLHSGLRNRYVHWFPHVDDPVRTQVELSRFYATRSEYHQMTADEGKVSHPQTLVLFEHLDPSSVCLEFGCGGGVVTGALAKRVRLAVGTDIAQIALRKAVERCGTAKNLYFVRADNAQAPFRSGCADVVYSFEMLEHVWDPEAVLLEMIRVLKPNGKLIISMPNGFPLDLHLKKRALVALADYAGAASLWLRTHWWRRTFRNMEPDLQCHPIYADCDMITKIVPTKLRQFMERHDCSVERLETYFLRRANASNPEERARFDRLEGHPLFRHFGDWLLLVARKRR